MFITKNKELANSLIGNEPVEKVVELARQEIKANPYRNCQFEFDIRDNVKTEEDLNNFKNKLKDMENELDGCLYESEDGFKYMSFEIWNDSQITFKEKFVEGEFIKKNNEGKWQTTGIYLEPNKELTQEEIATLKEINKIPA